MERVAPTMGFTVLKIVSVVRAFVLVMCVVVGLVDGRELCVTLIQVCLVVPHILVLTTLANARLVLQPQLIALILK